MDINQKISLAQSDPDVSRMGGAIPFEDDRLYEQLGKDFLKYLSMRRDPRVGSLLEKRVNAVVGRNLIVKLSNKRSREEAPEQVATIEEIVEALDIEQLYLKLLGTGMLIGFSVIKMDFEQSGEYLIPRFTYVPQRRFTFKAHDPENSNVPIVGGGGYGPEDYIVEQEYELRLLTKDNPDSGERCPKERFILYTFGGCETPAGLGLGYSIYGWRLVKHEAQKHLLLMSNRGGSPPVLGTHPGELDEDSEADKKLLKTFDDFLRNISPENWGRLPEGFAVNLPDLGAGPDRAERLIKIADDQITLAILGAVPFSEGTTGSYAGEAAQIDDRETSITDSDCNRVDESLNKQLWPLITRYNLPDGSYPYHVRRETIADQRQQEADRRKEEERSTSAATDLSIQALGLEPTEEYLRDRYPGWEKSKTPTAPAVNPPAAPEQSNTAPTTSENVTAGE